MKCCTYSSILTGASKSVSATWPQVSPSCSMDQDSAQWLHQFAKLPAKSWARGLTLETSEPGFFKRTTLPLHEPCLGIIILQYGVPLWIEMYI